MATQHVPGDTPFQKRVLIPFWVIRILFIVIAIIVYIVVLAALGSIKGSVGGDTGIAVGTAIGIAVVVLLILIALLVVDIVCIVKFHKCTLTTKYFLICNVVQTTVMLILFILSLVGSRTPASIAIIVIVFLSFLGLLIYAGVIFHKDRKGSLRTKAYAPALNPTTYDSSVEYGASQPYAPYEAQQHLHHPVQQPLHQSTPESYHQPTPQPLHQSIQQPYLPHDASYYPQHPHGGEVHEMGTRYT